MSALVNKILAGGDVRKSIMESVIGLQITEIHMMDTGGGCKTYFGKLSDGTYFVFGLGSLMLCDADYAEVFTQEFFDKTGGDTYEWEKEHKKFEFTDPKKVPEDKKDLVKKIISGSFEKLHRPVDRDFEAYLDL